MDMRQFAKPYEALGARWWFLPYRPMQALRWVDAVDAVDPQFEYTNADTGEVVLSEPEVITLARQRAATMKVPFKLDDYGWRAVSRWDGTHRAFTDGMARLVALEPLNGALPKEVQVFEQIWQMTGAPVAERWTLFSQLVSADVFVALLEGVTATQDDPAPSGLNTAETEAEGSRTQTHRARRQRPK